MSYTFNPFTGNLDVTPFSLDGAGKIPSDYLPSYVDDVVEYDDLAGFPGTGETGKIYVAKDTGYTYRWTGSLYVRIGSGGEVELNLGSEGSPSLFFNGDANTGLYSPGADQLAISTNATERARIDSSGRLLVGTSTALSNLSYEATSTLSPQIQVVGSSASTAHIGVVRTSGGGPADLTLGWGSSDNLATSNQDIGALLFSAFDGTSYKNAAYIQCEADAAHASGNTPGRLVFSTTADGASSPTERMRISNAGTHSFFCTATTAGIMATSSGAGTSVVTFACRHSASSTTTGTDAMYVYSNGNLVNTNNSYGAISDIKLKENIVDANSQWDDLKALQVRNYNFKEGQTHTQIGLVAQEAELVSPGLVSESPDRDEDGNDLGTTTKSVNYSVLYMKAVKALQEAMERIEVLEAKVNALEGN
jgi:hypothetical protein